MTKTLARGTDPVTSHLAAEKTKRRLWKLRLAVLELFARTDGSFTGSELNRLYAQEYRLGNVLVKAHPDTPRKRAGELAEDGLLDVVAHRKGDYGSVEAVYRISVEGRAALLGRDRA